MTIKMLSRQFVIFALLSFAPWPAQAADAHLLMFAAKLNLMNALVERCEKLLPGFAGKYSGLYSEAEKNLFKAIGINQALMREANSIPELEFSSLVVKFDKKDVSTRKQYCLQNLNEIKYAAESIEEPPGK